MAKYKKNTLNLKKLIVLISILFIFILICLGLIRFFTIKQNVEEDDELVLTDPVYINENNGKIYPENSFQFVYTFSGNYKISDDFYKIIYNFEMYLHKISKDIDKISENEIQTYFLSNQYEIKNKSGIVEETDFEQLVSKIKGLSYTCKLEKAVLVIDEKQQVDQYTMCPIKFIYNDGSEIVFDMYVSNDKSVSPIIKFM